MSDSVAEPEGENLLLEVWLRTQEGAEPTCVGQGLMCHKDHEWAGLKLKSLPTRSFLGERACRGLRREGGLTTEGRGLGRVL